MCSKAMFHCVIGVSSGQLLLLLPLLVLYAVSILAESSLAGSDSANPPLTIHSTSNNTSKLG